MTSPHHKEWLFWKALTTFRIAAIQHGVYARALAGNAGSSKALLAGDTVVGLIGEALSMLSQIDELTQAAQAKL